MKFSSYLLLFTAIIFVSCQPSSGQDIKTNLLPVADKTVAALPLPSPTDGFDFPVGPPNAKGYYNAQKFGENKHLGDDWNGKGGGNTDLGDPVFSVANGIVRFAKDNGQGWGNVIRVVHNVGTKSAPKLIESLYAHLDKMLVKEGDLLKRGQKIGTIGNANGAYWAHLHLEMRENVEMKIGGGYSADATGFLDPTKYILGHRPK